MKDMQNNKKIKSFRIRYAAIAVVALVVFGCGNLVTYAATGKSLVKQISVSVRGKKKIEKVTQRPDGSYEYKLKNGTAVISTGEAAEDFDVEVEQNENSEGDDFVIYIKEAETSGVETTKAEQ